MAPTGLHGFKNNPHAEQPNTESGPEVLAAALKEYGCAYLIGLALENFVADFEHGRDAVIRRRHGYMGNIAKAKRLLTEYESKAGSSYEESECTSIEKKSSGLLRNVRNELLCHFTPK